MKQYEWRLCGHLALSLNSLTRPSALIAVVHYHGSDLNQIYEDVKLRVQFASSKRHGVVGEGVPRKVEAEVDRYLRRFRTRRLLGDLFQMARVKVQEHEKGKRSDKVSWKRQRGYLHGNSPGDAETSSAFPYERAT